MAKKGFDIYGGLIDRGMPEHIAQAFMDSFQSESGLVSDINEKNPMVKGSRGGKGYYQLTGPRRTAYEEVYGEDYQGGNQLDHLMQELNSTEGRAKKKIWETGNRKDAVSAITKHFLRPAVDNSEHRYGSWKGGRGTDMGTQSTSKASEFASKLEAGLITDREDGLEQKADNRTFEEIMLGVSNKLYSPQQAGERMQASRKEFGDRRNRMQEKASRLASIETANDASEDEDLALAASTGNDELERLDQEIAEAKAMFENLKMSQGMGTMEAARENSDVMPSSGNANMEAARENSDVMPSSNPWSTGGDYDQVIQGGDYDRNADNPPMQNDMSNPNMEAARENSNAGSPAYTEEELDAADNEIALQNREIAAEDMDAPRGILPHPANMEAARENSDAPIGNPANMEAAREDSGQPRSLLGNAGNVDEEVQSQRIQSSEFEPLGPTGASDQAGTGGTGGTGGTSSPPAGETQVEKKKKGDEDEDPWNWKLAATDGLSALGMALGQMGSGATVNTSAVQNRRHATNIANAQNKRLTAKDAQDQQQWQKSQELEWYKAESQRINALKSGSTGNEDKWSAADFGTPDALAEAAELATGMGRPELAEKIKNGSNGARLAAGLYNQGDIFKKKSVGALQDMSKGQMEDHYGSIEQTYADTKDDYSIAQQEKIQNALDGMNDAWKADNSNIYDMYSKQLSDVSNIKVNERVATKAFEREIAKKNIQHQLDRMMPSERGKFERMLFENPEIQANIIERLFAEQGGNPTQKIQIENLKTVMADKTKKINKGLERRQTYTDMRGAIEEAGDTGPLHEYTLSARAFIQEMGGGKFLPKGWNNLGAEAQLEALNGELIRLNRDAGEGTMTDRDAIILSLTEAGLGGTKLGNLMLLQLNEKDNDVKTARAQAEMSWINKSAKDPKLDTFDLTQKRKHFEEEGVSGVPHMAIETLDVGDTSEDMNAAFTKWDTDGRKGHLVKFKNNDGATMYYQQGGGLYNSNGDLVTPSGEE